MELKPENSIKNVFSSKFGIYPQSSTLILIEDDAKERKMTFPKLFSEFSLNLDIFEHISRDPVSESPCCACVVGNESKLTLRRRRC